MLLSTPPDTPSEGKEPPDNTATCSAHDSPYGEYDTPVLRTIKFRQKEGEQDEMFCTDEYAAQLATWVESRGNMVLFSVNGLRVKESAEAQSYASAISGGHL